MRDIRYKNADVCKSCGNQVMINGFCEHCGYTDLSKKKPSPMAYIVNKAPPSSDNIYVSGIKKAKLDKIMGYKTISVQVVNNWVFLIKKSDLSKLNL